MRSTMLSAQSGKSAPAAPTEAQMGMPVYPGAKPITGMDGDSMTTTSSDGTTMTLLQTTDSAQSVIDYYKEHLTTADANGQRQPPSVKAGEHEGQPATTISQVVGNGIKTAEIVEGSGVTQIELMNIKATRSARDVLSSNRIPNLPNTHPNMSTSSQPRDQLPTP